MVKVASLSQICKPAKLSPLPLPPPLTYCPQNSTYIAMHTVTMIDHNQDHDRDQPPITLKYFVDALQLAPQHPQAPPNSPKISPKHPSERPKIPPKNSI